MMYWDNGHMDAGWGIAMMVIMLAFWALVAYAVTRGLRSHNAAPPTATPEAILAERLARGELNTEDYQQRLAALTSR